MNNAPAPNQHGDNALRLDIGPLAGLCGNRPLAIELSTKVTTLVGPNGTGKTQALKRIRDRLTQKSAMVGERYVRFLAAGRSSPFENYRSEMTAPGHRNTQRAAVGNVIFQNAWWKIESLTGDYLALEQRPDLLLKVQARLQQLLGRTMQLSWTPEGVSPTITSLKGESYHANDEASGVLQLVPLLAAVYNDQIGALLIDEPEISLHPQYQAFLLEELGRVAGNPLEDPTKKLVIIATHSPSMLSFSGISDLPNFVFFNGRDELPTQISASSDILKNRALAALMARASATHRMTIFAQSTLLVEGPSDEIIVTQLARTLQHPVAPSNTQILPITGKGEFAEVSKLLRLMGKRITILADLDGLTDGNELVALFSQDPSVKSAASAIGHADTLVFDRSLRSDFAQFVDRHWGTLEKVAARSLYWSSCPEAERTDLTKRRATLSQLLGWGPEVFDVPSLHGELKAMRDRYEALLGLLSTGGCFFLRRGAIEEYFGSVDRVAGKPAAAAEEAAAFDSLEQSEIRHRYRDVLAALVRAAPVRQVNET